MKPVHLEVIAPTPQGFGFCTTCELILSEAGLDKVPASRGMDDYPQEWQEQFQQLSDWVHELAQRYGDQMLIKVIDPQSPEGLLKSLRHWIRCYPTWIVNGKVRIVGWDWSALERAVDQASGQA